VTPPTKVSHLNSPEKTIQTRTNYSQTKTELQSEPASNKLHAFEIDWIDENVTTSEAMKYPHFTKIKQTQRIIERDIQKWKITLYIGKIGITIVMEVIIGIIHGWRT
jgi:hypothetical protein